VDRLRSAEVQMWIAGPDTRSVEFCRCRWRDSVANQTTLNNGQIINDAKAVSDLHLFYLCTSKPLLPFSLHCKILFWSLSPTHQLKMTSSENTCCTT
jgi:hypothetical protein